MNGFCKLIQQEDLIKYSIHLKNKFLNRSLISLPKVRDMQQTMKEIEVIEAILKTDQHYNTIILDSLPAAGETQ